jgi:two-component system, OmpR family, alkaline phosphatase synthesis response regulator PhoP
MDESRILIIDSDEGLAHRFQDALLLEGHHVEVEADGGRGLESARRPGWALVVTELDLPGLDGIRLLEGLRRRYVPVPVLVVSSRARTTDRVLAYRAGADAYLVKPVEELELVARVEALLRRFSPTSGNGVYGGSSGGSAIPGWSRGGAGANGNAGSPSLAGPIRFADVEVDPDARVVTKGGDDVAVTPKEFDLLLALVAREGKAVSREELLRDVWNYAVPVESRTVDTHVSELRRKLEPDPSRPRHLLTVRKVGYRWTS